MKLRQVLVSVLILIPLAVPAQDSGKGLSFDLSYMTRGEIRNGGLVKGDESADDFAAFLLGRTRLGLKYEGQGISSRLTAQHSGTWGSQGGGTLGIYEAWVQLQSRQGLFVRVGVIKHDKIRGFNSIYGSHHKFYGAMDFFYVSTYYRGFTPGLQKLYFGATWTPSEAFSLDASYHYLATATKLQNADRPLGHELECSAAYNIRKEAKISIGGSYMRGTDTMKVLKRSSDKGQLRWVWVMLTVTPEAFISRR
ncbi:MAG: hypothetical protein IJK76_06885 [Bacteroidales bacterium]|nr:hypothetical protein [Bacteroidales bacterium]